MTTAEARPVGYERNVVTKGDGFSGRVPNGDEAFSSVSAAFSTLFCISEPSGVMASSRKSHRKTRGVRGAKSSATTSYVSVSFSNARK